MTHPLFMLDTNTVSYIIKGEPAVVRENLLRVPMENICISSITEAKLLRGIAKISNPGKLTQLVKEFLVRVEVLPQDTLAAQAYAKLRTNCEREGKPLGAMDMLIASHSVAVGAILITNDKAFFNVEHHLTLQDWTLSH